MLLPTYVLIFIALAVVKNAISVIQRVHSETLNNCDSTFIGVPGTSYFVTSQLLRKCEVAILGQQSIFLYYLTRRPIRFWLS